MPLVDPVMMAHLPASCLAMVLSFFFVIRPPFSGGGFRNPGRRPQHLDVLDAVFVIRRRRGDETERDIEALEAGPRAEPGRAPPPGRPGELHRGGDEAAVGDELGVRPQFTCEVSPQATLVADIGV